MEAIRARDELLPQHVCSQSKPNFQTAGQRGRRVLRSRRMGTALSDGSLVGGRYRVIRRLVSGGMGAVYEVVDSTTNRLRALKVMHEDFEPDADMLERFRQEATVAGRVESEHVVEVFDTGRDTELGCTYLVMELLRGEDLGTRLRRKGKLEPEEVVDYLTQIALGLEKTHAEGIVHRDLKPENLFLTRRDDGSVRMKILDFGIAKVIAGEGTARTTRAFGTPTYMAPEQLSGDALIDARADLYALAHVAFTLLVGEPYFKAELDQSNNVFAFAQRVVEGPLESASTRAERFDVALPAGFDGWFERASHRDPDERFSSAARQIHALAGALGLPLPTVLDALPAPVEEGVPSAPNQVTEGSAVTSIDIGKRVATTRLALTLFAGLAVVGVVASWARSESALPELRTVTSSVARAARAPKEKPVPKPAPASASESTPAASSAPPARRRTAPAPRPKPSAPEPRDPLDEL